MPSWLVLIILQSCKKKMLCLRYLLSSLLNVIRTLNRDLNQLTQPVNLNLISVGVRSKTRHLSTLLCCSCPKSTSRCGPWSLGAWSFSPCAQDTKMSTKFDYDVLTICLISFINTQVTRIASLIPFLINQCWRKESAKVVWKGAWWWWCIVPFDEYDEDDDAS